MLNSYMYQVYKAGKLLMLVAIYMSSTSHKQLTLDNGLYILSLHEAHFGIDHIVYEVTESYVTSVHYKSSDGRTLKKWYLDKLGRCLKIETYYENGLLQSVCDAEPYPFLFYRYFDEYGQLLVEAELNENGDWSINTLNDLGIRLKSWDYYEKNNVNDYTYYTVTTYDSLGSAIAVEEKEDYVEGFNTIAFYEILLQEELLVQPELKTVPHLDWFKNKNTYYTEDPQAYRLKSKEGKEHRRLLLLDSPLVITRSEDNQILTELIKRGERYDFKSYNRNGKLSSLSSTFYDDYELNKKIQVYTAERLKTGIYIYTYDQLDFFVNTKNDTTFYNTSKY